LMQSQNQSQSYFTTGGLPPIVRLGVKTLETHDQRHFYQLNFCAYSLCNILSDKKMGLSLMNMLGLSSSVRIAHIACYWKHFPWHYTQVLYQHRLCRADHVYLTYLMLQRQLSHLNGRKLDWCKVIAHAFTHTTDLDYIKLETKSVGVYWTTTKFVWPVKLVTTNFVFEPLMCVPVVSVVQHPFSFIYRDGLHK
jgi:hypothetical protein